MNLAILSLSYGSKLPPSSKRLLISLDALNEAKALLIVVAMFLAF